MAASKPLLLVVLDGFGLRDERDANAVAIRCGAADPSGRSVADSSAAPTAMPASSITGPAPSRIRKVLWFMRRTLVHHAAKTRWMM